MRSLLGAAVAPANVPRAPPPPLRRRAPRPEQRAPCADAPRRSTRSRRQPHDGCAVAAFAQTRGAQSGYELCMDRLSRGADEAAAQPQPQAYEDSSVKRYVCERWAGGAAGPSAPWADVLQPRSNSRTSGDDFCSGSLAGFRRVPVRFADALLARMYSLDAAAGLLAAGGKDGRVAVWGLRSPQLAPSGRGGGVPLLLTAGNDGALAVWDLAQTEDGQGWGRAETMPRRLALADNLHEGGIFSMHVREQRVLTASKDGGVALCELGGDGGVRLLRRWGDHHAGVAKCARWRGDAADMFGSCGNDRCIRVTDLREAPGASAGLRLPDAHGAAVNCLRWHPADAHTLLSAASEPAAHLWDLRAAAMPLHALVGHISGRASVQIYQPQFVGGGGWVATGGQGSRALWLYDCASGRAVSHSDLGFDPAATLAGAGRGGPLVAAAPRSVYVLTPEFQTVETEKGLGAGGL
ncbi:hypothetical protein WJX81_004339 [Elliptochloris bilobata]|uniref:Uncharacterized protein n=1 Tax=Elliptochloris bilobata TaxID=381761 RepID=A0AAW1SD72_9CHLO